VEVTLHQLCDVVRTLSPQGEVRFRGVPDRDDWWVCSVWVGDVILFQSAAGPLDEVMAQVRAKLKSMSQKVRKILDPGSSSPPDAV